MRDGTVNIHIGIAPDALYTPVSKESEKASSEPPAGYCRMVFGVRLQPQHFPEPSIQRFHELRGNVPDHLDDATFAHVAD